MKNSSNAAAATPKLISESNPREIYETILIRATPEKVWQVLTDLERFSEWNPFIIESSGTIEKGKKIRNVMLLNGKRFTFKPRLLEVREGISFTWLGRTFLPGIMDGRHSFELEDLGGGRTRLIQKEYFSGLLAGWMMRNHRQETEANFRLMNEALKARAESPD